MLPELARGRADRAARARLAPALACGPWCWPPRDAPAPYALAVDVTGLPAAPAPVVGTLPVVTVEGRCGFAWVIRTEPMPGVLGPTIGPSTRRSWDAAALALPRAAPLIWSSVAAAHARPVTLLPIGTHLVGEGQAPPCSVVHGPSFGLAFLLLQASIVFGVALPGDLAASAAVTEDGRVDPVEGLDIKLAAIRALLPGVRRVLIAASQVAEAAPHTDGLEIVGVRSASQALEHVFGDRLAGLLLAEGEDAVRRRRLSEWFFRFALEGRGELVDWSPIAEAASRALAEWPDLSADERFQLGFARGIAERHEFNQGTLPVPDESALLARPAHLRLHLLAHLVQQSADVGTPPAEQLAPLLARFRQPDIREGHPMAWRLEGAYARLLSVTGHVAEALERQEQLARNYADNLLHRDISFPLAEWYRLSGVLRDEAAFERAEALLAEVEPAGALGVHGSIYVELTRARAALQVRGRASAAAHALDVLHGLAVDVSVPQHVRWSAARAWLREADCADPARVAILGALEAEASRQTRREHHAAAINLALVQVDDAVRDGDPAAAAGPIARVRALEPGLVAHLERAAAAGSRSLAPFVASCYPY